MQDDVGTGAGGILARDGFLHGVFVIAAQAGGFEDALENDLAPVALGAAGALQRLRQVLCLVGEALIHLQQRGDLLGERASILALLHVDLVDLGLELLQARLEGVEQLAEVGLVLLGEAAGFFLQDVVCQSAELVRHAVAGVVQQGQLLLLGGALGGECGIQRRQLNAQLGGLSGQRRAAAERDQISDEAADSERGQCCKEIDDGVH